MAKKKYRFSIFNDTTHEEIFSVRAYGVLSIATLAVAVILLIGSVTVLISFTSLRELIPGYPSAQSRHELVENAIKIDSLQNEINMWRIQLVNIQRIATGKEPLHLDSLMNLQGSRDNIAEHKEIYAKDDSLLRATVLQEEQFNLTEKQHHIEQIEGLHFFPPLKGVITEEYNLAIEHPYLDIAAAENSPVYSVLDGTVIYAGWDDESGYVIQVQHENNLVSIYKHNSKLLKKTRDKVTAGTPISLVGNTGALSTAPHLHFELWHKGEPINPAQYFKF